VLAPTRSGLRVDWHRARQRDGVRAFQTAAAGLLIVAALVAFGGRATAQPATADLRWDDFRGRVDYAFKGPQAFVEVGF
jgi:hypothetical protein